MKGTNPLVERVETGMLRMWRRWLMRCAGVRGAAAVRVHRGMGLSMRSINRLTRTGRSRPER